MNGKFSSSSERRSFLTRLKTGAASLAAIGLGGTAMAQVKRISNHTVYNAPVGAQAVALAALGRGEAFLEEQRSRARRARDAVLARLSVPHRIPVGGAYVFLDLDRVLGDRPLEQFLEACVERGLLLAPGEAFGSDYMRWARLCFTACPEDQLCDALAILHGVVDGF